VERAIEVRGLVRTFKGGITAVAGIDLDVAPGEIYGFLGPNGAGKSTTVHMLTTLLPPTAGSARVGGFDIVKQGPEVRRTIGAALQEAALDPLLTGREHLRLQLALHGIPRAKRGERTDELLARVGLRLAADRKIGGYSGGMKRRLDLALALAHRPRILFLDEPTTGLDPQSRSALWDEVVRLKRTEGVTVFLTTQYLEEADRLADRIAVLDQGRVVADGTSAQLKDQVAGQRLDLVLADAAAFEEVARHLDGRAVQRDPASLTIGVATDGSAAQVRALLDEVDPARRAVDRFAVHSATLDDVFLALTGRPTDRPDHEKEKETASV
jgi:ABC-2 type transport system ATP-binding protein